MHLHRSRLAPDEHAILFDSAALPSADRDSWIVPLHAWVYEDRRGPRKAVVDLMARFLESTPDPRDEDRLVERARPFIADDESWKRLEIDVAGERVELPLTDFEGHTRSTIVIPRRAVEPGGTLQGRVVFPDGDRRTSTSRVHLVGPTGVSVISDIDDTVKVSDVGDRAKLLENTFLRPFEAVPGMPELYREWAAGGVAFHYVSSSPWQLYRSLRSFFEDVGLPAGPMEMKTFSANLNRFGDLFADPLTTKLPVVTSILKAWPRRRFVLVGDSTEKDAEVYAEAARRHPEQVERIYIREVPGSDLTRERFEAAFAGIDDSVWATFDDPRERSLF